MNALELKEALTSIGWKGHELARRIEVSKAFVGQMIRGERSVPEPVAAYVEAVARAFGSVPKYLTSDGDKT